MQIILRTARVVATHDCGYTTDASTHDGVIQRPKRSPVRAAQHVVDIFVGEARDQIFFDLRNLSFSAITVIVDRFLEDIFSDSQRFVLVVLNMGSAFNLDFGGSGDDLGVEIAG